ncbi:hypothetical protein pipiens_011591 [Culex pipiens pipiens]|uniref:Uncharacterized protein n=1 Tax=Culex pipiens pipiens TaxID=38569 RepID=A0ABD1D5P9_CULPP
MVGFEDIENKKQGARRRGSRAATRNLEPERGDKREGDEYDEETFRKLLQKQQLIWESGSSEACGTFPESSTMY